MLWWIALFVRWRFTMLYFFIYYVNLILVFPVWGFVSKKSTARATKRGGPSDEIAKKSPASHSVWDTEQIPPPSSKTLSTKQRPKCCSFSPDILTLHMYVYKCIISERDAKQYRTDHYIPMIPHCLKIVPHYISILMMLPYWKFWIYWVGVNTKFTIW